MNETTFLSADEIAASLREEEQAHTDKLREMATKYDGFAEVIQGLKTEPPSVTAELIVKSADGKKVDRYVLPEPVTVDRAAAAISQLQREAVMGSLVARPSRALAEAQAARRDLKRKIEREQERMWRRRNELEAIITKAKEAERQQTTADLDVARHRGKNRSAPASMVDRLGLDS